MFGATAAAAVSLKNLWKWMDEERKKKDGDSVARATRWVDNYKYRLAHWYFPDCRAQSCTMHSHHPSGHTWPIILQRWWLGFQSPTGLTIQVIQRLALLWDSQRNVGHDSMSRIATPAKILLAYLKTSVSDYPNIMIPSLSGLPTRLPETRNSQRTNIQT